MSFYIRLLELLDSLADRISKNSLTYNESILGNLHEHKGLQQHNIYYDLIIGANETNGQDI
jgi:hypothetical protein